jgi:hypothetical protein
MQNILCSWVTAWVAHKTIVSDGQEYYSFLL